jgi:hypothetical protein
MQFDFTLKFKLGAGDLAEDELMTRLANAGCTDALVGLGLPGYIGLEFMREANSANEAFISALKDVHRALPTAELVEAGPDFVGLTEIADLIGVSRQGMRKIFTTQAASFPPPLHAGNTMVWHLAVVLEYLLDRDYEFTPAVLDVARTSMQLNLARDARAVDQSFDERLRLQLAA